MLLGAGADAQVLFQILFKDGVATVQWTWNPPVAAIDIVMAAEIVSFDRFELAIATLLRQVQLARARGRRRRCCHVSRAWVGVVGCLHTSHSCDLPVSSSPPTAP